MDLRIHPPTCTSPKIRQGKSGTPICPTTRPPRSSISTVPRPPSASSGRGYLSPYAAHGPERDAGGHRVLHGANRFMCHSTIRQYVNPDVSRSDIVPAQAWGHGRPGSCHFLGRRRRDLGRKTLRACRRDWMAHR